MSKYISIRFLRLKEGTTRDADDDPARDDIVQLVKLAENSVRVTYTEQDRSPVVKSSVVLNYQDTLAHLNRMFTLLTLDADPFISVQVNIPTQPAFIVRVEKLRENMYIILDALAAAMQAWPH